MCKKIEKRSVVGWVLFDISNTIFSTGMITLFFPLWIRDHVGASKADSLYGAVLTVSIVIIFCLSPILGSMTDHARRRMPFLMVSTAICVLGMTFIGQVSIFWGCIVFVLVNVAYQAGLQFYDSLLAEVSFSQNRGKVSGLGVSVGFLGAYIAGGVGLLFQTENRSLVFIVVALLFLIFALPCFFFVKEKGNSNPSSINLTMVKQSTKKTLATLRDTKKYPGLIRFLIGRAFYLDAINTSISVIMLYMINLAIRSGLSNEAGEFQAKLVLMLGITSAIPSAYFWGRISDRLGPKKSLNLVLISWMVVFAGLACMGWFRLPFVLFYFGSVGAGFALGGVGTVDRAFLIRLAPADRIGEFYGLYGMVGRFAAVAGPAIWASVTFITIQYFGFPITLSQALGITIFFFMTIIGYLILRPVSDQAYPS